MKSSYCGIKQVCPVEIKREISSSNVSSVLTIIIENKGNQDCRMEEFVFADTIPDNFASINEILFSPEYSSREGWKVFFNFPSFNPGESKVITYTVKRWVPPSSVDGFKEPELSAKKKVISPPTSSPTPQNQQPSTPQPQQPPAKPEEKKPAPETPQPTIPSQPPAGISPNQSGLARDFISEKIAEVGLFVFVGLIIAIALIVAYMVVKRKRL
ncbi:MAG: hypothetical protein N3G80_02630 [Candidatus Micrarchaeota archaeon]|nr:hypothetical protein [Candidatus Micrarchaeota archaeon]